MSQRLALSVIFGGSLLVVASSVAEAATIFTNFGPGFGYDITSGNPAGNAFDGNHYAQGNTFTPSSTTSLQSLLIALSCTLSCPNTFSVTLNGDSGDQPGAILESFSVAAGTLGPLGVHNAPILLNSVLLPQLIAGTHYWVVVSAPLTDSVAWNLNSTGDVSDQAISTDGGTTWFSPSGDIPGALQVNSTPEPGTLALMIGGGLLLGLIRRRRRERTRSE